MQLTSFTDYSLRTLIYLAARPGKLSSVREIAEYYGISRNHLVKIAHHLSQLSYIETIKGKGGGLRLAENAGSLRLGDLIMQLEPDMHIVECFNKKTNNCKITDSCRLKHYLFGAGRAFIDHLNKYTLADTVGDKSLFQIGNG